MKKFFAFALMGMAATAVLAKDDTLLDDTDVWQMYTRPELTLTDFGGNTATLGSLSVGWMLNDKLSIGPTVTYALSDTVDDDIGDVERFDLWYAGVRVEYTCKAWELAHASAAVVVGGGNVDVSNYGTDENSGLMVVEPSVNVAVNAWDWVELGLGIGYRFTDDIEVGGYEGRDFQDWNLSVFARFTEF